MKVFVTKYALSAGIQEVEAQEITEKGYMRPVKNNPYQWLEWVSFDKKYWHHTREEAVDAAEEQRKKKIASLRKHIEKLEKMKF